jgi:hypothetical protein
MSLGVGSAVLVRTPLTITAVAALAALALATAARAGEPAGRVLPSGSTSQGGDFSLFFNTDTLAVEGLDVQWACSVAGKTKVKPTFEVLTHAGIGHISPSRHVAVDVKLPYTNVGASKQLGKAEVKLDAALDWGPETTTSIRRATAKGTVSVKSASCSTGTLTVSARNH